MSASQRDRYDVVVVGGGHNGLVAAAYLAQAGRSVLVLERLDTCGGAAANRAAFPGLPAAVSTYAPVLWPLPDRILADLGLQVRLRPRRTASYTPTVRDGRALGLLVERPPPGSDTRQSFLDLTGSETEFESWCAFAEETGEFGQKLAPSLLEPLATADDLRSRVSASTWSMLVEEPLGRALEARFADDLVRGVAATDALMGTFADLHAPSLEPNRCLLQQLLGGGTGQARVPVGGAGALTGALERAARSHGVEILTRSFVTGIESGDGEARVAYQGAEEARQVAATWVLADVAPWALEILLGEDAGPRPEGSQVRVNLLVERLPRLRAGTLPALAFSGTLQLSGGYERLAVSYQEAEAGWLPGYIPATVECPSLTDPSVLGTLAMRGVHVLSLTAMMTPARLFTGAVEQQRDEVVVRLLDEVNAHIEEPLETLLVTDPDGRPCLEALAPQDVEAALALPGGHMYHGELSWPWADDVPLETPAQRWGVHTRAANVLRCGAGAQRGGIVTGIGGHNAAMAVLEAGD